MKIKCIWEYSKYITKGRTYEVIEENENSYLIINDRGVKNAHLKNYFKVIVEDEIKFEDIVRSPIKGIELNCSDEEQFKNNYIKNDEDRTIYIRSNSQSIAKVKPSQIPQLIEWLQKVNTYIEQVKNETKEMTMEEIEKELGYKIKIVGGEK